MFRVGILTVSDKGAVGQRQDTAGPALNELLEPGCFAATGYRIVPDEPDDIVAALVAWCDADRLDLILTCGGTGPAPRDLTPEATLAVAGRLVPGIAEAMRSGRAGQDPPRHAEPGRSRHPGANPHRQPPRQLERRHREP